MIKSLLLSSFIFFSTQTIFAFEDGLTGTWNVKSIARCNVKTSYTNTATCNGQNSIPKIITFEKTSYGFLVNFSPALWGMSSLQLKSGPLVDSGNTIVGYEKLDTLLTDRFLSYHKLTSQPGNKTQHNAKLDISTQRIGIDELTFKLHRYLEVIDFSNSEEDTLTVLEDDSIEIRLNF